MAVVGWDGGVGLWSGGVRLWEWARARSGVRMLALELRFARPNLFLKRALKELMNHQGGGEVGFNEIKSGQKGEGWERVCK